MRVRTLVQEAFRSLFLDVDLLLAPARLDVAPSASSRWTRLGAGPGRRRAD